MLVWYCILLFMYICLIFIYATTKQKSVQIPSWPVLQNVFQDYYKKLSCNTSADCPSTHICMKNECIFKLLRTEDCNSEWGQWISYDKHGTTFAICSCKNPKLMDQKHFGGDCNVNVGCGTHGNYLVDQKRCECDPGYVEDDLDCKRAPVVKSIVECDPENEIEVADIKQSTGFHLDYIKRLSNFKCVKRPCSFDAFSGRPLKHAKFVENWGCVCDPRYGLFGVMLEGKNIKYLNTPGYDACASIFKEDPINMIDVKIITYFYLEKREPISLLIFEYLDETSLIDLLQKSRDWMITQQVWQYDFAQYFFKNNPKYRSKTRVINNFFGIETVNDHLYANYAFLVDCHQIPYLWGDTPYPRTNAYSLLYKYIVCNVSPNDLTADPMFRGKVILNPLNLTLQNYENLNRYNAFVLQYEKDWEQWTVDVDRYKVDVYRTIDTNAPKYVTHTRELGDKHFGAII